jgi:hypothetical protein
VKEQFAGSFCAQRLATRCFLLAAAVAFSSGLQVTIRFLPSHFELPDRVNQFLSLQKNVPNNYSEGVNARNLRPM